MNTEKTLGQIAYEAHTRRHGDVDWDDGLTDGEKRDWENIGQAAAQAARAPLQAELQIAREANAQHVAEHENFLGSLHNEEFVRGLITTGQIKLPRECDDVTECARQLDEARKELAEAKDMGLKAWNAIKEISFVLKIDPKEDGAHQRVMDKLAALLVVGERAERNWGRCATCDNVAWGPENNGVQKCLFCEQKARIAELESERNTMGEIQQKYHAFLRRLCDTLHVDFAGDDACQLCLDRIAELETSEKSQAAMREALEQVTDYVDGVEVCYDCGVPQNEPHSKECFIGQSLANDAGKDYIHKSELDALQKKAAAMRDAFGDILERTFESCNTDDAVRIVRGICKKALSNDAGKGYVRESEVEPLVKMCKSLACLAHKCQGYAVPPEDCDGCCADKALAAWRKNHPKAE